VDSWAILKMRPRNNPQIERPVPKVMFSLVFRLVLANNSLLFLYIVGQYKSETRKTYPQVHGLYTDDRHLKDEVNAGQSVHRP